MTPRLSRLAALTAAPLLLAGCVSLLPKEKPVQLYRLDPASPAAPVPPSEGERIGLVLSPVDLPRAAAGDRILTLTGEQAAYIGGARWVSPAAVLVEEVVERGFEAQSRATRLFSRAESGAAQGALRLDAPAFETRYATPGATPTVRVELRALLLHKNGVYAATRSFTAEVPAQENGVHAIVAAYDVALGQAVTELVAWTDANAALAAAPAPMPPPSYVTRTTTTTSQTRKPRSR